MMNDLLLSQVQRGVDFYKSIPKEVKNKEYDIIIAHETFCSGFAALHIAERSEYYPFKILDIVEYPVFSQRTSYSVRKIGTQSNISDDLTFKFAINISNNFDHAISTSEGQKKIYKDNGCSTEISLLRNCRSISQIDTDVDFSIREKYKLEPDDVLLVYPNRAYLDGGLEIALKLLSELDFKFKLVVVGDVLNEIYDDIYRLIDAFGLSERVFVTGLIDPKYILPALQEADAALILLEPTVDNHVYSLPNRVFDAIATTTPIICLNGTEISDFVNKYQIGEALEIDGEKMIDSFYSFMQRYSFYKNSIQRLWRIMNWEVESKQLVDLIVSERANAENCLILAGKDISRNDRVRRISSLIYSLGIDVDLVSKINPLDSMRVSGINYYATK